MTGMFTLTAGQDKLDLDAGLVALRPASGSPCAGTSFDDFGHGVVTDAAGNVYVADWFFGTIDVDGGPGVHYVTSNGLKDALVVKYTAAEALVWARSFGGANEDVVQGLAVTGDGSLLVTGSVHGHGRFRSRCRCRHSYRQGHG